MWWSLLACHVSTPPVTDTTVEADTDTDTDTDSDTDTDADTDVEVLYSGDWTPPDRTTLDHPALPPGPDGVGFTLLENSAYTIYYDPSARTPLSAAGECAAVIAACVDPKVRSIEGCFMHVPVCATETPWVGSDPMCCPSACLTRFRDLRAAGADEATAATNSVFRAPSCMPGLDAWLGK